MILGKSYPILIILTILCIMPSAASSSIANFEADNPEGYGPYTVYFHDLSTGIPTNWSWEFGDGNASTDQNPSHLYDLPGDHLRHNGDMDCRVYRGSCLGECADCCDHDMVEEKRMTSSGRFE